MASKRKGSQRKTGKQAKKPPRLTKAEQELLRLFEAQAAKTDKVKRKASKKAKAQPRGKGGKFLPKADAAWGEKLGAESKRNITDIRKSSRPRDSKGRFLPKNAKFSKLDTGRKPSTRKAKQRSRSIRSQLDSGKIPSPDIRDGSATRISKGDKLFAQVKAYFWRFNDKEELRDTLILLVDKYGSAALTARVAIGSGIGKNEQWISGPYDDPGAAASILYGWENRASAQPVIEAGNGAYWFELEILTRLDIE